MKIKSFLRLNIVMILSLLSSGLFFANVRTASAQASPTWSDPVNLSNSGSSIDPAIVIDAKGIIHVVWVDKIDGYKYVESSDGVNWSQPKTLQYPFSPRDDSRPTFVADPKGAIHVFWRDNNNVLFYSQAQSSTLGDPGAWTGSQRLAESVVDFDAVVDSQGGVHVSYARNASTNSNPAGIYYRKLGGAGWSAPINLYASQYFRSLTPDNAHVRVSVSESDTESNSVYVAWDDRLQKRIFLSNSLDNGGTWGAPMELKGPEDYGGTDMPYNVEISADNHNVLLTWQVGQPGGRCIQYSQWSMDGGNQFGEPVKVLSEPGSCPKQMDFISHSPVLSVALLNIQDDLSMIAWNGSRWSDLQPQTDLSVFLNPATFDNVLFGCQQASVYNGSLFVVGCDKGPGGDIWFRSRPLNSLDEWFPSPSAWTAPVMVTGVRQKLSSLVSVADSTNTVHAFWVQAPLLESDSAKATIQYAQWSEGKWSTPSSILSGFGDVPVQLSVTADKQGRLFLAWNEGQNGDLYFSWANAARARISSEWSKPQQVPTPSQISSSPDFLVDDSGTIVLVYAVPLNEGRGIYIVQSRDLGKNWTPPLRVFDAAAANWDSVGQPRLALSSDGRLHVLFSRLSLRDADRTGGVYYVQSLDGGSSWGQPEMISEQPILWSQVVGYDGSTVHRLWQEDNGLTRETFDQVSRDGGETWGDPVKVSSINNLSAMVTLASDLGGHLYVEQTHADNQSLIVDVFQWDGTRWLSLQNTALDVKDGNVQYLATTDITSQGSLVVMLVTNYPDPVNDLLNEIIGFSRSVELSENSQTPSPFLIPTPAPATSQTIVPDIQLTPTVFSPLANINDTPPAPRKNLMGLLLVGGMVFLIILVIWPRRKREGN